ncbi:hypothetical protein R6Q57_026833 [Mikania cordata]
MAQKTLFFIILTRLFTILGAQERAPHGLAHETLVALSPSAYIFFHPNQQLGLCEESNCSPLPFAATVQSSLAHESRVGRANIGAGCIAAVLSCVFHKLQMLTDTILRDMKIKEIL